MNKIISINLFLWFFTLSASAQQNFLPPVAHEMRLSGTFGELRTDHFHTGVDIKSENGRKGDPIYAAWDGYVSRIHINIAGYGNALYIDHPNGMTSVYAHLRKFNPVLDSFLLAAQYDRQIFMVDTLLSDTLFKVNQGDIIGYMGDSGYSFGPHLHFELRNTQTERPINPLGRWIKIQDQIAPIVKNVFAYVLNEDKEIVGKKRRSIVKTKNGHSIKNEALSIEGPYVAFGLETFDQADKASNKNGIYQISMIVDDEPSFSFAFDSLDFKYKSLINTHIDYAEKKKNRRSVHRCLLHNVGHPYLGDQIFDKGIVTLSDTIGREIEFIIEDKFGNETEVNFSAKMSDEIKPKEKNSLHNVNIPFHQSVLIKMGDMSAFVDKNTFEKNEDIHVDTTYDPSIDYVSLIYHLGEDNIPVLKPIRLSYNLSHVPDSLRDKCFISKCNKSEIENHGSLRNGMTLYTEIKNLGDYAVMIDTTGPEIIPKEWSDNWTDMSYISFIIKDNYEAKTKAVDLITDATIDGQWVLFKYDYKNALIRYDMDVPLEAGAHSFKMKITDDLGNASFFNETIVVD